jgi:hypothetical protein
MSSPFYHTERYEDFQENDRLRKQADRADLWTSLPVVIGEHQAAQNTVTIDPALKLAYVNDKGVIEWKQIPTIKSSPLLYLGGGGMHITIPVAKGDEGLAIFASRGIDAWWANGGVQNQDQNRTHHLTDAFVIPGFHSQPNKLKDVDTTSMQMRTTDGKTNFNFNPTSGGSMTMTAPNNPTTIQGKAFNTTVDSSNHNVANGVAYNTPSIRASGFIDAKGGFFVNGHPIGTGGGGAIISPIPPVVPDAGTFWWDPIGGQLYVWYDDGNSAQWVAATNMPGPQGPPGPVGSGTITGVIAGIGLSGGGTNDIVTIDMDTPVAISLGGTGASAPVGALANLGGLPIAGGTMQGFLTLSAAPAQPLHAATRTYVDTAVSLLAPVNSPQFTGIPRVPTAPTATNDTTIASTAFVKVQPITFIGDIAGSGTLGSTNINITNVGLQGRPVAITAPTTNQVLQWSGTAWAPAAVAGTGTVTTINVGVGLTGGPIINIVGTIALAVPVAVTNGGTGIASGNAGGFVYFSNANTISSTTNWTIAGGQIVGDSGSSITVGGLTSQGPGTVNAVGLYINGVPVGTNSLSLTGGTLTGSLGINGSGSMLLFGNPGLGLPTVISRSIGTRIVLWNGLSTTEVDYAIGMDGGTQWFSVPNNTTARFRWFGGTSEAMSLGGNGVLSTTGVITAPVMLVMSATGGGPVATNGIAVKIPSGGEVNLIPGSSVNTGYIEWRLPNAAVGAGARLAYLGWNSGTTFGLQLDTATVFAISGTVTAPTFVGALTGQASLNLPLTGGTLTGNLNTVGQTNNGWFYTGINSPAYPTSFGGLAISWNFNVGQGDVDFWNCYTSGSGYTSFFWYQLTTAGSAATKVMQVGPSGLLVPSTFLKTGGGASYRMSPNANNTGIGSFWYTDTSTMYLLLTANNDAWGSFNGLRPFAVDLATGVATFGHRVTFNQGVTISGIGLNALTVTGWNIVLQNSASNNYIMAQNSGGSNVKIYDDGNSHIEASAQLWINNATGAYTQIGGGMTVAGAVQINGASNTNGNATCQGNIYTNSIVMNNTCLLYGRDTAGTQQWLIGCWNDNTIYVGDNSRTLHLRGSVNVFDNQVQCPTITVGGLLWQNYNSGWWWTGSPIHTDSAVQAGLWITAGTDISAGGQLSCSGNLNVSGTSYLNGNQTRVHGTDANDSLTVTCSDYSRFLTIKPQSPQNNWCQMGYYCGGAGWGTLEIVGQLYCDGSMHCGDLTATGWIYGGGNGGAQIRCWAGDWGAMSYAMSGGYFEISPDQGVSGFYFPNAGNWSDARLKLNIRDSEIDALAVLGRIPVRAFEWNDHGRKLMPYRDRSVTCGLVAQEVEELIPSAVDIPPLIGDDMKAILYEQFHPYYIRAIQQLKAENDELMERLTRLEQSIVH